MSKRSQLKVSKYALVKFLCDGKTLQTKTRDLQWTGQLKENARVKALWYGSYLHCTVLGLSDDPTVLNEIERTFMRSLRKRPSVAARSSPAQLSQKSGQRRSSVLVNRAKRLHVRKNANQGIEFIDVQQKVPEVKRLERPVMMYDQSSLSDEARARIRGIASSVTSAEPSSSSTSSAQPPVSTDPAHSSEHSMDVQPTLGQLSEKLDEIFAFMRRLEDKVDSAIQPRPVTLSTSTQTEPIDSESSPVQVTRIAITPDPEPTTITTEPEQTSITIEPEQTTITIEPEQTTITTEPEQTSITTEPEQTSITTEPEQNTVTSEPGPTTIITQPEPTTTEPVITAMDVTITPRCTFPTYVCDNRFWCLKPQQFDNMQVSPGYLTELTRTVNPHQPICEDKLPADSDLIASMLQKSHSASHLAKNILFHCFTLKEVYNRNAYGKTFRTNGVKKSPLNLSKMKALVDMVKLHYNEPSVEKTVTNSVNTALRNLWGRKLNQPWLKF